MCESRHFYGNLQPWPAADLIAVLREEVITSPEWWGVLCLSDRGHYRGLATLYAGDHCQGTSSVCESVQEIVSAAHQLGARRVISVRLHLSHRWGWFDADGLSRVRALRQGLQAQGLGLYDHLVADCQGPCWRFRTPPQS
jgi:hypothetical protein